MGKFTKGNRNAVGHGYPRGRKRAMTAKERAARKASASKPRNHLSRRALASLREFCQLKALDFLTGPAYARMVKIVARGNDADACRAYFGLCDRFGLPVRSIQDVRAEIAEAPLIEYRRTNFPRPGTEVPVIAGNGNGAAPSGNGAAH